MDIFSLAIHFRYVDGAQMGQKILKTRTGMTFMEKTKIPSWEITRDTCDTKIDSMSSFKEKINVHYSNFHVKYQRGQGYFWSSFQYILD